MPEEKLSQKKQQLVETGKKLFLKHGVKRIPIEEICRESEVSKVTFYKYFKNKQALISTIGDGLIEEAFSKFDEINKKKISYVEKINLMSTWRVEFFSSLQGEFLDQIIEMKDFKKEYMNRFIANIMIAQKTGELRKELSPELIALVTEKMREITLTEQWRDIFSDYATYQDQLRTIMFFGMLTDDSQNQGV